MLLVLEYPNSNHNIIGMPNAYQFNSTGSGLLQVNYNGTTWGAATPTMPTNGYVLAAVERTSGGTSTLYLNGSSVATSSATPGTPALGVGTGGSLGYNLCEFVLFNSALTTTQLNNWQYYEINKWAL